MTEESLFEQAAALAGDRRTAFLRRECPDPAQRARIEALLAADARPNSLFDSGGTAAASGPVDRRDSGSGTAAAIGRTDSGVVSPSATDDDETAGAATTFAAATGAGGWDERTAALRSTASYSPSEAAGAVVGGKYALVERIGEGGMGSVWRAKQSTPVKRFVAVKLIKAGMDSSHVLNRFEAERQALALMDHPNIAKVLDGGLHDGRPYFVMELVKGAPITEHCDKQRLTPAQRLELFVQVCQAIQHAHQKGVIHRDIKPSNVLIALYDDRPVVKVIDFGVAKATGSALTEATIDTGFGGVVGTPAYMSPEQATFNNLDIDTRTDVYALGVLLYELLTGSTPFGGAELKRRGLMEMLRVVREEEPPRPSTKLSTAEALPSISSNRATEPKKLTGLLRNELDWIVMKALEKERARRYETANGFAADVQRYLAGEAVLAHPPSAGYRLRKLVRRHRGQTIAASAVLLTLVAGVVGTSLGLAEARRQATLARGEAAQKELAWHAEQTERAAAQRAAAAEKAAKEDADLRRREAERNLGFARKGNAILGSVFEGLDPQKIAESGRPLQDVLKDNLKKAVADLDGSAIGDPLVVAEMQNKLGISLLSLGEYDLAIAMFTKAAATRRIGLGLERRTLTSMGNLAVAYKLAGRFAQALPLYKELLARRYAELGPDDFDTLHSMGNLGECYRAAGELDEALPLLNETFARLLAKVGPSHVDTLVAMGNLANTYAAADQQEKALPLLKQTVELRAAKHGIDHPTTLLAKRNLGAAYLELGMFDKALPLCESTLVKMSASLGADHPDTLSCAAALATCYRNAMRLEKALPLFVDSLERLTRKLGADHPQTLECAAGLAVTYRTMGQPQKALPLFISAFERAIAKLGPDHPQTLSAMSGLAACYWSLRRLDRSIPLFEALLPIQSKKLGRSHAVTLGTAADLGVNYSDAGRMNDAIPLLEEAYRDMKNFGMRRGLPFALTKAYVGAGKMTEAIKLIDEVAASARKDLPPNSPQRADRLALVGSMCLEAKEFARAESPLRECLSTRETVKPNDWTTFNSRSLLGAALFGQQKHADSEPLLLSGYEGMKARESSMPMSGGGEVRIPEALDRLIALYEATNKPADAKKYRDLRAAYAAATVSPPPKETSAAKAPPPAKAGK